MCPAAVLALAKGKDFETGLGNDGKNLRNLADPFQDGRKVNLHGATSFPRP